MIVRTRGADYAAAAERGKLEDALASRRVSSTLGGGNPEALAAVGAAIEWAAAQVAMLPLRVWRGTGLDRVAVSTTWQARFFAGEPNPEQPWVDLLEQTQAAIEARGNAFWQKTLDDAGRIAQVWLVPPGGCVATFDRATREKRFAVRLADGATATLGRREVTHFRGPGAPGEAMAPSRIERYAATLGALDAKIQYERDLYENGAGQSIAVSFPRDVPNREIAQFRDVFQSEHATSGRRGRVKVFGGGATVSQVGISPADAELVASLNWSVADVARAFGVPLDAILAEIGKGDSADASRRRWRETQLPPRLLRIAQALRQDAAFFGAGARDYPQHDMRGVLFDATVLKELVQVGVLVPDEGRAELGYAPLPDGVGQVPQITPVGGAPNAPAPPGPAPAENAARDTDARLAAAVVREAAVIDAERRDAADAAVARALEQAAVAVDAARAAAEAAQAAAELRADVTVNVEPTPITVEAPIVNVDATPIEVVVNVPDTAPPVVNVLPAVPGKRHAAVKRDGAGRITSIDIDEIDEQ